MLLCIHKSCLFIFPLIFCFCLKLSMNSLTSKLTEEQRKQLCDLLGNVELSLLYKASVHGYQASAFHQRCDRQGPTLIVAYNRSGYIFGGYTSVEYARSGQYITDKEAFLFSFQGKIPVRIKINSGHHARLDDAGVPSFGQQLYFCYNNQPVVNNSGSNAFSVNTATMYGNDTQLTECEVYKVEKSVIRKGSQVSTEEKPWRNVLWTAEQRDKLMEMIRNYKPLVTSVSCFRILMIGPVGAGKSSFFNSINSIFMSRITSKAMSGSAATSLTTQFRTYPVKDGREGIQGHVPDRYKFNPTTPFQPDEQKSSRPASLQEKIHCVVYVIDATKISLMSDKLQEKLASIRRKVNSLSIPQIVLMTKVDEACPLVEKDLQNTYASSYIKTKVQEVSSRLGVPVSCVLPVKNYSQELELELNCDVLLLTALQQMLNFADDYLDDADHVENKPK
uniref:TLDc domain-containing protein n=1 Tax=Cyprinus carpio carpio TaxID=630221 RepID=A0A8C1H2H1_CYPCA